jgi:hypothetical protein
MHCFMSAFNIIAVLCRCELANPGCVVGGFKTVIRSGTRTLWAMTAHLFAKTYYAPALLKPVGFVRGLRCPFGASHYSASCACIQSHHRASPDIVTGCSGSQLGNVLILSFHCRHYVANLATRRLSQDVLDVNAMRVCKHMANNCAGDQTLFLRAEDFWQLGGFDERLAIMEDADLVVRAHRRGSHLRPGKVRDRMALSDRAAA